MKELFSVYIICLAVEWAKTWKIAFGAFLAIVVISLFGGQPIDFWSSLSGLFVVTVTYIATTAACGTIAAKRRGRRF